MNKSMDVNKNRVNKLNTNKSMGNKLFMGNKLHGK